MPSEETGSASSQQEQGRRNISESLDGSEGVGGNEGGNRSANGSNKKRKKNATMACNTCRRKRNRCIVEDGESLCKGCKASGAECVFAEFDKRRDGIAELRERLTFFEKMFESVKPGDGSASTMSVTSIGSTSHAAFDQHLQDGNHEHPDEEEDDDNNNGFNFLASGNNGNDAYHDAAATSASASATNAFFEQLSNTITPQSSVRSNGYSSRQQQQQEAVDMQQQHKQHNDKNGSTDTNGRNTSIVHFHSTAHSRPIERPPSTSTSVHKRVSARTPDMSAVMDSLAVEQDGRIRAYGATSSIALAGFEEPPNPKAVYSQRRYQSTLNSKDPARQVTPPADTQPMQASVIVAAASNISALPLGTDIRTVQHLLHLYFMWAWPMFPIVSRQIFMQHFSHGGQYYSPLLLNALLALASHLSDWKVVRAVADDPYTAGATFFDMAKSLLEDELERPSVTTVQALALMAKRESYCGRPLRGGLYMAMCGRLVLDLGLHLDCLHLIDRGILTDTDRYVRAVAFWGIWSVDKEYSAMVGRPCSIRNVVITCPKPGYWALEDFDWWEAHRTGDISQVPVTHLGEWKGPVAISRASLEMANIHLKAMERLHWGEEQHSTVEHSRNLETSMAETREAMAALPSADTAMAQGLHPHLVTLTMTYHCHIIIINRPFLFDDPEERASRPPSAAGGIEDTPRKRCFHSAQELIRLMEMFKSMTNYGLRPILNCHQHNVVIAAAILIFQVTSVTGTFTATYESRIANELLQRAFALLSEMSEYRPAARQALENLRNSFNQRRKREARLVQGAPLAQQASEQKSMNPFGYSPIFQSVDHSLLDDYALTSMNNGATSSQLNGHAEASNGHTNVPSYGIMDNSIHAPLFYATDGPLDDFSDLDSFLAQHSGYLYSADLLKDFPGGT